MGPFGAYGKIPALGDFFRVNVDPAFVDPWDRWLQSALLVGQAALGEAWQDRYLSAPIWRFTLSTGVAGPRAVQGVLMPSVDRVGRLFPLTLVTALPGRPDPRAAHGAAPFDALETLALDALDDSMTRATLAARLAVLPNPPPTHVAAPSGLSLGVWSALLADHTLHQITTPGLPAPSQIPALFAPGATP